ncbi:MAG TPA: nucleotidyltransferase domain-containing protein [Armatimonadota bacterium]|nr:nucleotidyltransferase domain-containing protein [Armatimonadota bacterium]
MRDRTLDTIVQRVVETEHPERIILFGSRARQTARPGSDYDLLIVKESDQPRYRRSVQLYTRLADVSAEVDILVYTPEEIAEWSAVPQAFVTTAVREGKVLYERQS